MDNLIIPRSNLVEFPINTTPSSGMRCNAELIPSMGNNNIILFGFELYTATQMATAPSGRTVVAASTAPGTAFTLRDVNKMDILYNFPYYSGIRINTAGLYTIVKPRKINLTDCYALIISTTGLSANETFLANFYFEYEENLPQKLVEIIAKDSTR